MRPLLDKGYGLVSGTGHAIAHLHDSNDSRIGLGSYLTYPQARLWAYQVITLTEAGIIGCLVPERRSLHAASRLSERSKSH